MKLASLIFVISHLILNTFAVTNSTSLLASSGSPVSRSTTASNTASSPSIAETLTSNLVLVVVIVGIGLVLFCVGGSAICIGLYLRKEEARRRSFQQKFLFGFPAISATQDTEKGKVSSLGTREHGSAQPIIGALIDENEITATQVSYAITASNGPVNAGTTVVQHGKALSLPGFMMMMPSIDFNIEEKVLAEGGGGLVKTAKLLASHHFKRAGGDRCVIKMIKAIGTDEETLDEVRTIFYQEVSITHLFDNSNYVVKMVGFCPDPMALLTKFYPKGSVADLIRDSEEPFSSWVNIVRSFCLDTAKAIKEIHKTGIVHNDIKPDNLLLDPTETNPYHVVLCDFGVAMVVENELMSVHAMKLSRIRGASLSYASPEMIELLMSNNEFGEIKPADVYAYSITCFELLSRDNAWKIADDDIVNNILSGKRPQFNMEIVHHGAHDSIVSGLIELIEMCWEQNPRARPNIDEVVLRLEFIK